ncbi:MAG: acyltransferase domain-containing protein [Thermoanaerobaculia bacterium]|nr:acyltransferase domain-containing protein [Thermoanaerobaculia bacterium]
MSETQGVAIIGMWCRAPGASSPAELWENLRHGKESIRFYSRDELLEAGCASSLIDHPSFVPAAGSLERAEHFAAKFFELTASEARRMDPQHRVFLECCWQALENAGMAPGNAQKHVEAEGDSSVGVFAGMGHSDYLQRVLHGVGDDQIALAYQALLGNDKDFLANRVAHRLNLTGPAITLQTGCSTSLVAVHVATQALLNGECDLALAGGVAIRDVGPGGYLHTEGMILSEDGHCRPFDASASGTVGGSGVGVVVLKRLEDALDDGDPVRAVILGSAVNNDGSDKVGFTAPGVAGQARVIAEAQAMAGVEPDDITYVEAHGTGTPLGDPIEVAALTRAFRLGTKRTGFCALGSVKSNLGHLDTAAGIAGLIKTVLSLEAGEIPASLHYREPNPEIDFATSPFFVNAELRPWHSEGPRRAGVSSFGLGGTNAHVVLGEAPSRPASGTSRPVQILTLSAKTGSALESATDRLRDHLAGHPQTPLADVAHTLQIGRQTFAHRRVVLCRDVSQAVTSLGDVDAADVFTGVAQGGMPEVAMLFSGQGAQFAGMGRGLYRDEPVFRKCMDRCFDELGELGRELADGYSNPDWPATWLVHTSYVQPLLFSVEYSLAQLWRSWGILPSALAGHSLGELVAACVAEVMSLSDALALVALRGRLMHDSPAGGMLAVSLGEQQLTDRLPEDLDLAAVNGPESTVVAGGVEALERFAAELTADDVASVRLLTNRPFHSRTMDEVADELVRHLAGVDLRPPKIPLLSNVTGGWMQSDEATDPASWGLQVRQPVQFSGALERLLEAPDRVLLEVGPGRVLCGLARRHTGCTAGRLVLPSMLEGKDETEQMLRGLGQLWLSGVDVDWSQFSAGERRHKVALPTYPFERRRYWIDRPDPSHEPPPPTQLAPEVAEPESSEELWVATPSWKRLPTASPSTRRTCFLVLHDDLGLGEWVTDDLRAAGHDVKEILAENLATELEASRERPVVIVHLLSVTAGPEHELTASRVEAALEDGLFSLLDITRALAGRPGTTPVRIDMVSTGLQDVTGNEPLTPEKAPLLGPVRVIPQEHPDVTCRSIDIPAPGPDGWSDRDVATLVAELTAEIGPDTSPVLALRGRHRWGPHYEPTLLPEPESVRTGLRDRGVYLITGGLGEIGLGIARRLAENVQAKLVLTARTPLPTRDRWPDLQRESSDTSTEARVVTRLLDIEAAGGEVLVLAADVSAREAMARALTDAKNRFGEIHGVFHGAGTTSWDSFSLLAATDRDGARRHLRPKVEGLLVLDELLRDEPLDFLFLHSSLSTTLGGLGYGAYAAANLFLDHLAEQHARNGSDRWIAVDWDAWQNTEVVGRAESSPALGTERGLDVCFRLLTGSASGRWIVSARGPVRSEDSQSVISGKLPHGVSEPDSKGDDTEAGPALHGREELLSNPYVAPTCATDEVLVTLWQSVLGIARVGIEDDFFELGGDSLQATQLVARIHDELDVQLDLQTLFELPTVVGVRELIEERSSTDANVSRPPEDRVEVEL